MTAPSLLPQTRHTRPPPPQTNTSVAPSTIWSLTNNGTLSRPPCSPTNVTHYRRTMRPLHRIRALHTRHHPPWVRAARIFLRPSQQRHRLCITSELYLLPSRRCLLPRWECRPPTVRPSSPIPGSIITISHRLRRHHSPNPRIAISARPATKPSRDHPVSGSTAIHTRARNHSNVHAPVVGKRSVSGAT